MPSVRAQIFGEVQEKLDDVLSGLGWKSLLRNPRELVGEDQFNAIVMLDGGDRAPIGLTGHVEETWLSFGVVLMVTEQGGDTVEELLDAGFVAVCDALIDPQDIQLSGLAIGIERGEVGDPLIGRSDKGARIVGVQSIEFMVNYMAREGDASTPGP